MVFVGSRYAAPMAKKQRTTEWEAAVGRLISERRHGVGMSQSQLARASGVPYRSLQNYEQGHRPVPLEAAARLAKALRCAIEDIIPPVEIPASEPKKRKEK